MGVGAFDGLAAATQDRDQRRNSFITPRRFTKPVRMFTCQALDVSELLIITLGDVLKMKLEFYEIFSEIFNDQTADKLRMQLLHKLEVIRTIEEQELQKGNGNISAAQ